MQAHSPQKTNPHSQPFNILLFFNRPQAAESANNSTTKKYHLLYPQIDKIDFNLDGTPYPTYFYNLRKDKDQGMKHLK